MKTKIALLAVVFLLLGKLSYGDVISIDIHPVSKCVKITNLNDYPDVLLIGYFDGVIPINNYYIISSDCLKDGYRLYSINVFAVNKTYLEGKDITKINWLTDDHAIASNIQINPGEEYINDENPLSAIEEYYKIIGFSPTNVMLFKWKEVNKYNNGLADSIKTFTCTEDITKLSQKIITGTRPIASLLSVFDVYPNPAYNKLNVKIQSLYPGIIPIEIIDMKGKVVKTITVNKYMNEMVTELNIEDLPGGTYSVSLRIGKYKESKKIVIK